LSLAYIYFKADYSGMIRITRKSIPARKTPEKSPVMDIRPCSLSGAAAFLKQEYLHDGKIRQDQNLILTDPATGERNIAAAFSPQVGPRLLKSYSQIAIEKNRLRRKKYYENRDKRKKAQIGIGA
jgi:hypothetical protein